MREFAFVCVHVLSIDLELLCLGEGDLRLERDGDESLERMVERMGHRGGGGVMDRERQGGHVAHTGEELRQQGSLIHVEDGGGVHGSVLIHILHLEPVKERANVHLVEHGDVRQGHLLAD
jgi:hypothetical protein